MRFGSTLAAAAATAAMGASQAAAEPQCLARGETFGLGQYACLNVGDKGKLALCETAEGAMNWRTIENYCPGGSGGAETSLPADQAANCLADAQSFGAGWLACLRVGGDSYLARCDLVLNASSWTKVEDDCPGNPPLNAEKEPDKGSWKPLEKPRELLDRFFGRS